VTGVQCQVNLGACTCDGIVSPGTSQCPPALTPICCQSASYCMCSYNSECASGEQQVPSCSAAGLQPLKQCPTEQTLVASCH
jgi:hypothetical protein